MILHLVPTRPHSSEHGPIADPATSIAEIPHQPCKQYDWATQHQVYLASNAANRHDTPGRVSHACGVRYIPAFTVSKLCMTAATTDANNVTLLLSSLAIASSGASSGVDCHNHTQNQHNIGYAQRTRLVATYNNHHRQRRPVHEQGLDRSS